MCPLTTTAFVREHCSPTREPKFQIPHPHETEDLALPGARLEAGVTGTQVHDAVSQYVIHKRCHAPLLPYASALDQWAAAQGVHKLIPDWCVFAKGRLPAGDPDVVAFGGPHRVGVLEIKTRSQIPSQPEAAPVLQLSTYLAAMVALGGLRAAPRGIWGAVVYVCPPEGRIRLFLWKHAQELVKPALLCSAAA